MKKITILLDTKEDSQRIKNVLLGWFKDNFEEHLIKKLEVEDD